MLLQSDPALKIGIPKPYFATSVGNYNVIGMERLRAKTFGEIKRGLGIIPPWINIDELKIELKKALDILHANGIYHRDLHENNVMIPQTSTPQPYMAYIIDFGLTTHSIDGSDPYKSSFADNKLTFTPDHAIFTWMNGLK